jgi:hypothetical protein
VIGNGIGICRHSSSIFDHWQAIVSIGISATHE